MDSFLSQAGKWGGQLLQGINNVFNPPPSQPVFWAQPKHEVIKLPPDTAYAAETPAPQQFGQQLQQQLPQQNDGFVFDFNSMPRDASFQGPRTNFQPQQPPQDIGMLIRQVFPNEATAAATVAASENGTYDSNRPDNPNTDENGNISYDRGIFQINSGTFDGFMKRNPQALHDIGVYSFDDMRDPKKNVMVAKMIKDGAQAYTPDTNPNGWGGWFGWQDTGYDLNKGYFSKNDRIQHALAKKKGK